MEDRIGQMFDPSGRFPPIGDYLSGVDSAILRDRLGQGQVAVIAGFQGIGADKRITTLGRGGSDTSAVAVATNIRPPGRINSAPGR